MLWATCNIQAKHSYTQRHPQTYRTNHTERICLRTHIIWFCRWHALSFYHYTQTEQSQATIHGAVEWMKATQHHHQHQTQHMLEKVTPYHRCCLIFMCVSFQVKRCSYALPVRGKCLEELWFRFIAAGCKSKCENVEIWRRESKHVRTLYRFAGVPIWKYSHSTQTMAATTTTTAAFVCCCSMYRSENTTAKISERCATLIQWSLNLQRIHAS